MSKNKKGFVKISIVVVVIIAIGIAGYFVTVKKQKQDSRVITILSPNGGEKFIRGQEYLIKWKSGLQSSAPINISFVKNSFVAKDIYKEFNSQTVNYQYEVFTDSISSKPISNTGNYLYKIPSDMSAGDNWQIMIWSGQSCDVRNQDKKCSFDFSDNFFSIR